jgi:hydroxymethylbilane synthase
VLQADLVAHALRGAHPGIEIVRMTRVSEGDRQPGVDLRAAADKGLFTVDLSRALLDDQADAVVHSWKDLPIEGPHGTTIAATLLRADPRDVLLVRREVADRMPAELTVLTSSPRRAWQITTSGPRWLPWRVETIRTAPVRGNVPTRLKKLVAGEGDALIVAKAALDRLLSADAPSAVAAEVRAAIDRTHWMVLPLREHPTAPAQGALAIETAANRPDLVARFAAIDDPPTRRAVAAEREILRAFGGGCHEAVGATVLERPYGRVTSVRADVEGIGSRETWTLDPVSPAPPRAPVSQIWPRPEERDHARRRLLDVPEPRPGAAWFVSRAEALPTAWHPRPEQLIWAAGGRTWERLARRGIWVHGSTDGLGDVEPPDIALLAGRGDLHWLRLTHTASGIADALGTYVVDLDLPGDLAARTHFFWTSGSACRLALARFPALAGAWHASGPGRTAEALRETLGASARLSVWLDYDQWHQYLTC